MLKLPCLNLVTKASIREIFAKVTLNFFEILGKIPGFSLMKHAKFLFFPILCLANVCILL